MLPVATTNVLPSSTSSPTCSSCGDSNARLAAEERERLDAVDAVIGEALDDLALARHDRAEVDRRLARVDAQLARVADLVRGVAGRDQRLGRHAAAQDAQAAERTAVDERDASHPARGRCGPRRIRRTRLRRRRDRTDDSRCFPGAPPRSGSAVRFGPETMDTLDEPDGSGRALDQDRVRAGLVAHEADAAHQVAVGDPGRDEDDVLAACTGRRSSARGPGRRNPSPWRARPPRGCAA